MGKDNEQKFVDLRFLLVETCKEGNSRKELPDETEAELRVSVSVRGCGNEKGSLGCN